MKNYYFIFMMLMLFTNLKISSADSLMVYFGTYTSGESSSKGIYVSWLDLESGKLSDPVLATLAENPSFIEIHPNDNYLYAVRESGEAGMVGAYEIDKKTGLLTFINEQPSQGEGPCHLNIDHAGKNLLVANYGGGSVGVIPIKTDGQLSLPTGFGQHRGSSINVKRQSQPRAHSVNVSPDDRFAFVPDLGIDKIMIYKLDVEKGIIKPNQPSFAQLKPGAGPRHFSFHPNGIYAYVINELNSTITAFNYETTKGVLTTIQNITTLPVNYNDSNSCAEIRVHPGGQYLYGSNRGHDSIAIYQVNQDDGTLVSTGHMTDGIKTPRNFNITPNGEYCIVANQGNSTVIVLRIDQDTGGLEPTGSNITLSKPVCVRFF
jgi:6-phosphogluconolactonase